MKSPEPIDVESVPKQETTQALVRHHGGEVGQALTASEITERLRFIKQVMAENMTEGKDYGKVPGCGDKPGLFQPGAQKLSMTFQLNPEVLREEITDYHNLNRGYRLVVRVTNGSKFADGVGECSTLEAKYRWRNGQRVCPDCGKPSIIIGKAEYGGGFVCFKKKGGCGGKFPDTDKRLTGQSVERVENDNPPDHWNTVRKMAFKRAFVHAIINATNTSELWSQDLEDLHGNNVAPHESETTSEPAEDSGYLPQEESRRQEPTKTKAQTPAPQTAPKHPTAATRGWMIEQLDHHFGPEGLEPILAYFRACGQLLPSESLKDLPFRFVPANMSQLRQMMGAISAFIDGREAKAAFPPPASKPASAKAVSVPRDSKVGDWRAYPVPFGKNSGVPLGKLQESSLMWYIQNFDDSETFEGRNGKPIKKKPEQLLKDRAFRGALDAAAAELGIDPEAEYQGED